MSERYKREIEEILEQAGEPEPSRSRRRLGYTAWRLAWLYVTQSLGGKRWSLSPGRIMLIAVLVLLAALVLRAMTPGVVAPLGLAGLLLFILGYGLFFVKPPKIEKRWRGQPLEDRGESLWDRLRRRMR